MLTYELKKERGKPLYEGLYQAIRGDILSGVLPAGTKLPSKRALSDHLKVSGITVEGAYNQLLEEGYISSRLRVGYFVEDVAKKPVSSENPPKKEETPAFSGVDITANTAVSFPFSVWSRLQREVMGDYGSRLLMPLPNLGSVELRQAIAKHLRDFRDLQVEEGQILIGAGTDFLYNLLIQLLGREKTYGVEDPGYDKIRKIYTAGGAKWLSIPVDEKGMVLEKLGKAQVLHISPAHHFPTGVVMPMDRRQALLRWLAQNGSRYIIEDEFDSEFRFRSRPLPTLMSMDHTGRVIYMNTFSKSLAPSIRISYLVLPKALMERFQKELGFYSCTVASFEQYTLARFLSEGHFERHMNRMRKSYKSRRDEIVKILRESPYWEKLTILEKDAGLHFLAKVDTDMTDGELVAFLKGKGIKAACLSAYYEKAVPPQDRGCIVVNYSGLTNGDMEKLRDALR